MATGFVELNAEQQARADALHKQAVIIDGHNDVLMAVADGKVRLSERYDVPEEAGWEPPLGLTKDALTDLYNFSPHTAYFQTIGFYDIPRLLEGGITAQAMSIYLSNNELDRALHRALDMVYWLHKEAEDSTDFSVVQSVADIHAVKASGKTSGYLTLEGLEPLGYNLKLLDIFHRLGLRMSTLTHSRRNAWGDGGGQPGDPVSGGLTDLGEAAVARMNELGIVIDLAHMNLRGGFEILKRSEAPIVVSHARSVGLHDPGSGKPGDVDLGARRELWQGIADGGGMIGIIGYSMKTLGEFVDNIQEIAETLGEDYVGLGTDFYGMERSPLGFRGMHETPNVTAEMVRRGFSDEAILKILGGNYLRVFETVWGE